MFIWRKQAIWTAMALLLSGAAQAAYPEKPVRLIVPFPAGGVADMVARSVSQEVGKNLGQPVVVENKPGASAIIGTDYVAKAPADGYTLLLANLPVMAINELQFASLPYKAAQDLQPVVLLAEQPYIIAVAHDTGLQTMDALVGQAKKDPKKLTFGSASSSTFLAGELFKARAGIEMAHIPYKGSNPAINDLLGGHISLLLDTVSSLAPHVESGKLYGLAVTSSKRSAAAPGIPSYRETGLTDMDITSWQGIAVRAGTPKDIVERLNKEFNAALKEPAVRDTLLRQGVTPAGGSAEDFSKFVQAERERWGGIAKQVGFKPGAM